MLQIAVLGAGPAGERHARALGALADRCLLAGVYDADPAAAARTAAALGVPVFDGLPAAIDSGAEAAVVAGSLEHRVQLARAALEQGLDVLIEPPLAAAIPLAHGLLSAVVRAPRRPVAMVSHELRFDPTMRALRDLLAGQSLISVLVEHIEAAAPGPAPHPTGDVISELMIHDLQMVLSLSGEPIAATQASGRRPRAGAPLNHAQVLLTMDDDTVVSLVASRAGGPRVRRVTATTTSSRMVADLDEHRIDVVHMTRNGHELVVNPARIEVPDEDPLTVQADSFLRCVECRTAPKVGIGLAIATQEAALTITKRIELVARRPARRHHLAA